MRAPLLSLFIRHAVVATGLAAVAAALPNAIEGRQKDQQRFLTDWYDRADFYESKDAKLGRLKITPESELELGRNANFNVTSSTDSEAQAFVQQLVTRLSGVGPQLPYPITVVVYEAPEVNALTVPGRMFVSTGLLRFVDNEAELAAVASHELSHIYAHHAARRVIRQARGQAFASFLGSAFGAGGLNTNPTAVALAALGAQTTIDLFQKAFSRGEESEADRYAMHVMFNAGFQPQALGAVLTRMYRLSASRPLKLLSTHPPLEERMDDLNSYARGFPQRTAAADSPSFLRAIRKQPETPTIAAATPAATPPAAAPPVVTQPPPASSLPPVVVPPASSLPPVVVPPASSLPPVKRPPGNQDPFDEVNYV